MACANQALVYPWAFFGWVWLCYLSHDPDPQQVILLLVTIPRFLLIITGLAIALLGLGYLMLELLAPERSYLAAAVPIIVGYLTTMVAYSVTYSSLNKKTNTFVAALLTGMVAKMFAGLITIVIVSCILYPLYINGSS